jgi:hypothetical protein
VCDAESDTCTDGCTDALPDSQPDEPTDACAAHDDASPDGEHHHPCDDHPNDDGAGTRRWLNFVDAFF